MSVMTAVTFSALISVAAPPDTTTKYANGNVPLRTCRSSSCRVVLHLDPLQKVRVSQLKDDYFRVDSGADTTGFVRALDLSSNRRLARDAAQRRGDLEAPIPYPARVSDQLAARYGCNLGRLESLIRQNRERGVWGTRPRVGQTACAVLAQIGEPDETTVHETAVSVSASWWYHNRGKGGVVQESRLVRLEERTDTWVVTSVSW